MAGILIDEQALSQIRSYACCICGTLRGVQAHHIIHRGMGGGQRFDHLWNLLPACYLCHEKLDGMPKPLQFALVAVREWATGRSKNQASYYERWVREHTRVRDRKDT